MSGLTFLEHSADTLEAIVRFMDRHGYGKVRFSKFGEPHVWNGCDWGRIKYSQKTGECEFAEKDEVK